MEVREQVDYLFCSHCNQNVSRSTYRRHQVIAFKRKQQVSLSSSSDSDISDDGASETLSDANSRLDSPNSPLHSWSNEEGK